MTKRRAYGSVHGAIMQDVGAIGLQLGSDGHEAVAAFLGLNSFAPRRWGDPDDTRELSLLRAGQIAPRVWRDGNGRMAGRLCRMPAGAHRCG